MRNGSTQRPYLVAMLTAALVVVAISAWRPWDVQDWLLENALVAVALPLFVRGHARMPFTLLSYGALLLFLCLHEIGAHYTYSEVPYGDWIVPIAPSHGPGTDARNHYDRFVHFCYGLLVIPAAIELFAWRAPARGLWRWILPLTFIMAHSVVYELVEWGAAVTFGGDLGQAYLGSQGDPWDAQKDMALAALGAIVGMALLAAMRWTPLVGRR
ncbi:putative membrane protein [Luteibacter sp. UNC138MFCol5.1]|uniref:DUF2238 domain-containing protein n=1 Tax=Luteibacter sp. UNC138MFCol5.1 TaxID=1502774 RepID=UPI0008BBB238|nr:DUF2238 domain-containing protein [Luteibacter sp. UNC138MFCol5.1]SEO31687.1 putative membrane protein [Luteibacter sp. UNC138MFCol5.1]